MTIEQPALPVNNQPKDNANYAKIREFTGKNYQDIHNAVKACENKDGKYEVEDVINWLISKDTGAPKTEPPNQVVPPVATEKQSEAAPTEEEPAPSAFIGPKNKPGSTSTGSGVIDLTNENNENDEIQRAIAESLRDNQGILGGQISREEQEISRVLEQSLLEESKAGTKRKRGDIWFVDPLNPHERKRSAEWPVGLKNVGNTCWFSAVIQSLFNLPKFRQLVLSFLPPGDVNTGNSTERRNLNFMQELRHLFALMVFSKKKYVDPSKAVEILKEAFTSGQAAADSQQDVSEFQHKLLEWLEDAFRSDQSRPSSPAHGASGSCNEDDKTPEVESSGNPMMQLFYGQYLAEGMNEGKSFTNKETFGQFPLQVDGFRDIHESLDGATAQGEIETVSQEITSKSGQELWFTCLPPVLTFELSRFQFNQSLGRPEKIHNRFTFPEVIFMDRYMECNKCVTRQKREEVKKLKERLTHLQHKLDKFINYGSGSKRFPLQDVLQYALEFAQSRETTHSTPAPTPPTDMLCPSPLQDIEMESPKSNISMVTDSPVGTPTKPEPPPPPLSETSSDVSMDTSKMPNASPNQQASPAKDMSVETAPATTSSTPASVQTTVTSPHKHPPQLLTTPPRAGGSHGCAPALPHQQPSPRHVSHEELDVLQVCLQRWRTEVEQDVKELQDHINQLEKTMNSMYTQPGLKKCPYRLHAVLVHEGQAASGHYWAYVFSLKYNKWLKFNDITVTEASWEELEREGAGGHHNTSAYCLMYVDPTRVDNNTAVDGETGQSEAIDPDLLPDDLLNYVKDDNDKFDKEIEEWDLEQRRRAAKTQADSESPSTSRSSQTTQTSVVLSRKPDIAFVHTQMAVKQTYDLLMRTIESKIFHEKGPQAGLHEACKQEVEQMSRLAQSTKLVLPRRDPRLYHMLVYLLANSVKAENIIKRILLEPFVHMPNLDQDESAKTVRAIALRELHLMGKELKACDDQNYQAWHSHYEQFRKTVYAFITGLTYFHKESYVESLPYFTFACDLNQNLISDGGSMRGMDTQILGYYHRQCLLHVNEQMSAQCESQENIGEYLDVMNKLVLPCLTLLQAGDSAASEEDQSTVEEIRSRWCKFLSLDMSKTKLDKLQDFLARLLDTPTEVKSVFTHHMLQFNSGTELDDRYGNAVKMAEEAGYLEVILNS